MTETTLTAEPQLEHDHAHPAHLAHHFETSEQQFEAGKFGLWLFLTTEVLLFSGLFCVYSVYRAKNPEIFEYAHKYLSVPLGATNTVVLLFSSFTMAWAVRASQLGQTRRLVALLAITLLCACGFLGIKFVEYKAKWEECLMPGGAYNPTEMPGPKSESESREAPSAPPVEAALKAPETKSTGSASTTPTNGKGKNLDATGSEKSTIGPAAIGDRGVSANWAKNQPAHAEGAWDRPEPNNVHIFFGIYFAMTGLHGLHVLAGMGAIGWVMARARRGEFGPDYYTPVDFVGLYWHLVDLVWIFLFPLLYLIT